MRNLLKETLKIMEDNNLHISDIYYIGTRRTSCTWDQFQILANREYDSGYGGQRVLRFLTIMFHDRSKLVRKEYDGSEWWEYEPVFKIPEYKNPLRTLFYEDISWDDMYDIDEDWMDDPEIERFEYV